MQLIGYVLDYGTASKRSEEQRTSRKDIMKNITKYNVPVFYLSIIKKGNYKTTHAAYLPEVFIHQELNLAYGSSLDEFTEMKGMVQHECTTHNH